MDTPTAVTSQALVREAAPWLARFARFGYATKGLLYVIIGGLALRLALGLGGKAEDAHGAVEIIGRQPFGKGLLVVLTLGLAGHALWRFTQAVFNVEHCRKTLPGVFRRILYGVLGGIYSSLAVLAARAAFLDVSPKAEAGDQAKTWTAKLLEMPYGVTLVVVAGVVVACVGVWNIKRAIGADFMEELATGKMSSAQEGVAKTVGRLGLLARAVTFGVVGWFIVKAAMQHDPSEARGMREALLEIARQPYGAILLGIVAAGLTAYGLHCFVQARFRRLPAAA
jgi:hypothetical protein